MDSVSCCDSGSGPCIRGDVTMSALEIVLIVAVVILAILVLF